MSFKQKVDALIALVREKKAMTPGEVAYLLDVSPNYLPKIFEAAEVVTGGAVVFRMFPGTENVKQLFTKEMFKELEDEVKTAGGFDNWLEKANGGAAKPAMEVAA